MWIDDERFYGWRDPYWLLLNPLKKFSHFWKVKKIEWYLSRTGFTEHAHV